MTDEIGAFWGTSPSKVLHPLRVPILEPFRWIGEPLSAIMLVDVLDGGVTMWQAGAHLDALVRLGVLRRGGRDPHTRQRRNDGFAVLYRLEVQWPRDDG